MQRSDARGTRAAALLPDQQGAVVAPRSQPAVRAGAPAKPEGANFYPDGASKAEIERWIAVAAGRRARRAPPGSSRDSPRRRTATFSIVPYSVEYQNELARTAALLREAAALADRADAQGVPDEARRRVSVERLLRQRRGLDGAEGRDRADDRSVRGLRGRVLQLQGGVRGVHHRAGRSRERQAAEVRRRAAGHRKPPADRPEVPQPEARRARAASSSSTRSSPPATATAACRPRRSTCRTTSAS